MKVMIVDDEPLALSSLRRMIGEIEGVTLSGTTQSARAALQMCETLRPDVVVLDIEMPQLDGVTLARELRRTSAPLVIFVTAYDSFAVNAFDVEAIDYVLKPVDPVRLREAIERARGRLLVAPVIQAVRLAAERLQAGTPQQAAVTEPQVYWAAAGGRSVRIPVPDILHVEACRDYAFIHTEEGKHMIRETMANLEAAFSDTQLQRVHRSHIVNLDEVVAISHDAGSRTVTLASGKEVPVGRRFYARLRAAIDQPVSPP